VIPQLLLPLGADEPPEEDVELPAEPEPVEEDEGFSAGFVSFEPPLVSFLAACL